MSETHVEQVQDDGPPIAEFVAHMRASRRGMAIVGGTIFTASLLIAALLPPRFDASATLAVMPAPEFTVRQDAGTHGYTNAALALDQIMKAETAILQSDDLHATTMAAVGLGIVYPALDEAAPPPAWPVRWLRAAAKLVLSPWRVSPSDPNAARQEQALHRFARDLHVVPTKEANIVTVTFGHQDGKVAARVVNTMLARYAAQRGQLYDDPQLAAVRRETSTLAQAVRDADRNLSTYKSSHGISDSTTERGLLLNRQSETTQALAEAEATQAAQAARRNALDRQIRALPLSLPLYNENDPDTRLQAIDASLVALRGDLVSARVHYRETSRRVTDLRAQLLARETERARMENPAIPSVARSGRSPAIDPLLVDRAQADADAVAAASRAVALRSELGEIALSLQRIIGDETALAELNRAKTVADGNFANGSRILAEQRLTEAEDALRMANVRIIQAARPPQHPAPLATLICLAGALFGALASAAWLIVGFAMRPTFLTEEGLAYATGLPVLGIFPEAGAAQENDAFAR